MILHYGRRDFFFTFDKCAFSDRIVLKFPQPSYKVVLDKAIYSNF